MGHKDDRLTLLGKTVDALGPEAARRVLAMEEAMGSPVRSTYTVESLGKLIARVQERGALYTERGMDPLKVEDLLDDVYQALREMQAMIP
jgi:hypothetical protein